MVMAYVHLMAGSSPIYPNLRLLSINRRTLVVSGWTYIAIAALQGFTVARHIHESFRARQLSFGYKSLSSSSAKRLRSSASGQSLRRSWITRIAEADSEKIELLFQVRQFLEILLQTYQANQFSRSVARRDVHVFVVATIVVNCIHTPLLDWYASRHRRDHGHSSLLRLAVLRAIDIWLDFQIAVLLPLSIVIPHLLEFDFVHNYYPVELTSNDVWSVTAVNDGRQVLVTSVLDYISSFFPHVTGLLGLLYIKAKIRCVSTQIAPSRAVQANNLIATSSSNSLQGLVPSAMPTLGPTSAHVFTGRTQPTYAKVLRLIHALACVWAGLVVAFHVNAYRWYGTIDGCLVIFPAWLAKRIPCAALRFNCHAQGRIAGTTQEIHEVLTRIDRHLLQRVIFTHCPALEIPPVLVHEFPHLTKIMTFNCTIHKWDSTSRLTRIHTPTMSLLQLVDTNMTTIPDGLVHAELPAVLNLFVYGSNLSSLPDEIGQLWRNVQWSTLWLEYSQLTELPTSFSQLHIDSLSLEGSPVTSLPDALFANNPFTFVRLSKTRLTALPPAAAQSTLLEAFLADDSEIASVPKWLQEWASANSDAVVSFLCSPVCVSALAPTDSLCRAVDAELRNIFPYALTAAHHQL